MDDQQLAASAAVLDRYSQVSEDVRENAAAVATAAWLSFSGWYDADMVADMAAQMADLSSTAQQATLGAATQYVDTVLGLLTGRPVVLTPPRLPALRNGAPMGLVHMRPAEAYRKAVATGIPDERVLEIATRRGAEMMRTDVALTERITEREHYRAAGVTRYRRVVRPELSESGSCGLCIVASDRIYTVEDLMPIHPPHCKCRTMPITAAADPGVRINESDLKAIYQAAGDSTKASDLQGVRIQVNEHGELGPVLNRKGDRFRGPDRVALEDDPARADRMLQKTLPVLRSLEERAAAGENVAGPLRYQRELVARLRGIAA